MEALDFWQMFVPQREKGILVQVQARVEPHVRKHAIKAPYNGTLEASG